MALRTFVALLIGLAMALAPLGMPAMAEAASPAMHHGDMASTGGHCDQQQPQPDPQHKAPDKNCCAAMCIAVVVPFGAPELVQYHPSRERPASDLDRRGFLAEIATPPPKFA